MNNISKMNSRITIQKKQTVEDEFLQHHSEWQDYYTCWAYANNAKTNESEENAVIYAENTVIFSVRYCETLKNITAQDYRIIFKDKIYDIKAIDHIMYSNINLKITGIARS